MTLGRKGLTSGVIKGLTVCCFMVCLCFTVSTLLWMAVPELTGRRTVSKQNHPPPHRRCSV
ncbi:unnamed protein product, partial [Staurois parvus]